MVTSTAGCMGGGGEDYQAWLPEPDELSDQDHYSTTILRPEQLASNEDQIDESFFDDLESLEDEFDPTGIDFEDISLAVIFSRNLLLQGSFNQEEVISELENEGFDEDGEEGNYSLYIPEDADEPNMCYAVGSSILQTASIGDMDAVEVAEVLIESNNGDQSRYTEDSEPFANLQNTVGTPTIGTMRTFEETELDEPESGQFENSVASGIALNIDGESTNLEVHVIFDSEDDPDTGDLEDWVEESDGTGDFFDDVDDVSVNVNGVRGTVSGTLDTDDVTSRFLLL